VLNAILLIQVSNYTQAIGLSEASLVITNGAVRVEQAKCNVPFCGYNKLKCLIEGTVMSIKSRYLQVCKLWNV
jgi:hypothetical protein